MYVYKFCVAKFFPKIIVHVKNFNCLGLSTKHITVYQFHDGLCYQFCDWGWNLTKTKNKHGIQNCQKVCCICGYHVFSEEIWEEAVGELLVRN